MRSVLSVSIMGEFKCFLKLFPRHVNLYYFSEQESLPKGSVKPLSHIAEFGDQDNSTQF